MFAFIGKQIHVIWTQLVTLWLVFTHLFKKKDTVEYPDVMTYMCPTHAIQLTPDFEMAEYVRQDMVWEKEHMLINGTGKYHDYNFYKIAGKAIGGKGKGEARNEAPPIDRRSLLP